MNLINEILALSPHISHRVFLKHIKQLKLNTRRYRGGRNYLQFIRFYLTQSYSPSSPKRSPYKPNAMAQNLGTFIVPGVELVLCHYQISKSQTQTSRVI